MTKHALVLVATLMMAGCANAPYGTPGYQANYPLAGQITQGRPLAMLPAGAGPVLAVNETRKPNAILQDIVLGGSQVNGGENNIAVTALIPPDPTKGNLTEGDVKIQKPTDVAITDEIEPLFPNVPMHISPNFEQNQQGPFGYAIGHGPAGSTCVYAWQWIGPEHPISLLEGATGLHPYPISVRVRLCKPHASEASLVGLVRALVVYSPSGSSIAMAPMPMATPMGGDALTAAGGMAGMPAAAAPMPYYSTPQPPMAQTMTYAYPQPVPVYAPAPLAATGYTPLAAPVYSYPAAAPMMTSAAESSDDTEAAPPPRRSRHVSRRRVARRAPLTVHRTVVQREEPTPVIGNAIPLPSELTTSVAPRAIGGAPRVVGAGTVSPSSSPLAAQDGVPLPR
ncbi:cellulose biosynthesis protein BcsN [Lichenihabitans psoromatis]|uniref:cellulose biosynthesis protein BcsN n=1 Tax=Lichenihabitans psoromatis TaxID=2528642 RepID=UPI0010384FC3|nr:cellulose biosynthesis protein BcsN [Lichenihabitans psoromatis]